MSNKQEKLTPVYAAFYIPPNAPPGSDTVSIRPKRDRYGIETPTPTSKKRAIEDVMNCPYPAYAYQYGWKGRGFQIGESRNRPYIAVNEAYITWKKENKS